MIALVITNNDRVFKSVCYMLNGIYDLDGIVRGDNINDYVFSDYEIVFIDEQKKKSYLYDISDEELKASQQLNIDRVIQKIRRIELGSSDYDFVNFLADKYDEIKGMFNLIRFIK